MPRTARSEPTPEPQKARVHIENQKLPGRLAMAGDRTLPIRTVFYIEVGDMPTGEVQRALYAVNSAYAGNEHPIFAIPLRNGRAITDVLFEQEVLDMIRKICVVKDGEIAFKRDPVEVDTLRTQV